MKDLVLEAVKAFPVWPKCDLIIKPVEGTMLFVKGKIEKNNNVSFWLNGHHKKSDIGSLYVITREQHIRKRLELFEGAPEDTEFCAPKRDGYYQSWWKKVHGTYFGMCPDYQTYEWDNGYICRIDELIPRPTPEELVYITEIDGKNKSYDGEDKWIPEIGQECLVTIDEFNLINKPCIPKYLGDVTVFEADGEEFGCKKEYALFNPIKTEAEKQREYKIELLAKQLGELCPLPEVVNKVVDLGWEPPIPTKL